MKPCSSFFALSDNRFLGKLATALDIFGMKAAGTNVSGGCESDSEFTKNFTSKMASSGE
jgi:hypothetical protein